MKYNAPSTIAVASLAAAALLGPSVLFADVVVNNTGTTDINDWGMATDESSAQGFTADVTGNVTSATLLLYKTGSPTDNVYLVLEADSSGLPSGTVLATSDSHALSGLAGSCTGSPVTFTFTSAAITNGNKYWLIAERDGGLDGTNYPSTCGDNTGVDGGNGLSAWTGGGWHTLWTRASRMTVYTSAGGGTGGNTPTGFDEIFGNATTTASSTVSIVDIPTLDYGMAVLFFYMSFAGTVWFFRRPKI